MFGFGCKELKEKLKEQQRKIDELERASNRIDYENNLKRYPLCVAYKLVKEPNIYHETRQYPSVSIYQVEALLKRLGVEPKGTTSGE